MVNIILPVSHQQTMTVLLNSVPTTILPHFLGISTWIQFFLLRCLPLHDRMADPTLVVQVSENNKKAIFYEENTTYSLIDCLIHTPYRCFDQHPLVYCPKHTRISIYPYRTNHLTNPPNHHHINNLPYRWKQPQWSWSSTHDGYQRQCPDQRRHSGNPQSNPQSNSQSNSQSNFPVKSR